MTLSDLGRLLRPALGRWQLQVSGDAKEWFDRDMANVEITLRPAARRFELEFAYLDRASIRGEDVERLAAGSLPT